MSEFTILPTGDIKKTKRVARGIVDRLSRVKGSQVTVDKEKLEGAWSAVFNLCCEVLTIRAKRDAAPDMYEALKEMIKQWEGIKQPRSLRQLKIDMDIASSTAKAVITKAEGK